MTATLEKQLREDGRDCRLGYRNLLIEVAQGSLPDASERREALLDADVPSSTFSEHASLVQRCTASRGHVNQLQAQRAEAHEQLAELETEAQAAAEEYARAKAAFEAAERAHRLAQKKVSGVQNFNLEEIKAAQHELSQLLRREFPGQCLQSIEFKPFTRNEEFPEMVARLCCGLIWQNYRHKPPQPPVRPTHNFSAELGDLMDKLQEIGKSRGKREERIAELTADMRAAMDRAQDVPGLQSRWQQNPGESEWLYFVRLAIGRLQYLVLRSREQTKFDLWKRMLFERCQNLKPRERQQWHNEPAAHYVFRLLVGVPVDPQSNSLVR